jgi:hypothetical protein
MGSDLIGKGKRMGKGSGFREREKMQMELGRNAFLCFSFFSCACPWKEEKKSVCQVPQNRFLRRKGPTAWGTGEGSGWDWNCYRLLLLLLLQDILLLLLLLPFGHHYCRYARGGFLGMAFLIES